ncbi:MAG: hypothetical protein ACXWUG_16610 [Polyangiales bacterium]
MSEELLFFNLSAERLRARARWAGIVLCSTILLPYEVFDGTPQWTWRILPELPLAAVIATLAPTLAGAAILILGSTTKRATSLAVSVLATLAAAAATIKIGADAAAWDVLKLPSSFTERPTSAVLAMALAGAAANLTFKTHARKAARYLYAAACASVLWYYLFPTRGEAPLVTVVRALSQIGELPNVRYQVGLITVALFALWPLIAVTLTLFHLRVPAKREQSLLGLATTFGLPAWIVFLVYRAMIMAAASIEALTMLGAAALLAAILALITASLEVLVDALTAAPDPEREEVPGFPVQRAALYAGGAMLAAIAVQFVLARPPRKGVEWTLKAPPKEAEKLFAEQIPTWSDARLRWSTKLRTESGAQELVTLKGLVREVDQAAKQLDPGYAAALGALTHEDDLDVAGRRWHHLVASANEAARQAGLPYYLDPTVRIFQTADGLVRTFRVSSYRIEEVHPVKVGGDPYATLHVRALGPMAGHGNRLGFSRDLQPFALVVLDEIEVAEKDDRAIAESEDPRCASSIDPEANHGLRLCGQAVAAMVKDKSFDLHAAWVALTERHELQHQVDGPHLPLSAQVLARMTGYAEAAQRQANRELSAYIAELTAAAPPKLGLLHMAPFALVARGGPEHHVAVILLSALSKRPIPKVDRVDGPDTKELSKALEDLLQLDDATLRERAFALWKDAFGRKLPEITR